jgi:putative pyruvate formate lyase activating enzyme
MVLEHYNSILNGERKPNYLRLSSNELNEKIVKAINLMKKCELCEQKCGVNRLEGKKGVCRVLKPMISSCFQHFGEEHFLVPSYTVFFTGCNFKCVFCQNFEISQLSEGKNVSIKELSKIFENANSCKNLNLVGGSPTPQLPFILQALKQSTVLKPIIWNSNFFMSIKSMELLKGIIDVFLSDWKYGNNKCALKYSKIKNYCEIIERNHLIAFNETDLIIRHLVLPNHFKCCSKPVLEKIAELFGEKVIVNIMQQYRPCFKASLFPEINSSNVLKEHSQATALAEDLGLNFIF